MHIRHMNFCNAIRMFGAEADLGFCCICRLQFEHRTVLQLMTCSGDAQDFPSSSYLLESQAIWVK